MKWTPTLKGLIMSLRSAEDYQTWALLRKKYPEEDLEKLLKSIRDIGTEPKVSLFTKSLAESRVILYPDKRQRVMSGNIIIVDLYEVLFGPYDELPLYLEADAYVISYVLKWRFNIGY